MTGSLDRRSLISRAAVRASVLAASAASLVAVPPARAGTDEQAVAGELVIGRGQEPAGFDPASATASSSLDLIGVVCERLVAIDAEGYPQPELAESWETADGLTWEFQLRRNVAFHNGRLLTADDVVSTFARLRDPSSPWAHHLDMIDAVEATDIETVTFTLNTPFGALPATLASGFASILPRVEPGAEVTLIGTGPFLLKRWEPGVETVLAAHEDYRDPEVPRLPGVRWRIVPDAPERLEAIRRGAIHIAATSEPEEIEGVDLIEQDTTDVYLFGLNTARPPFDDPRVRRALSLAVDRQVVVDAVFAGRGQVSGPLAPTLGDWALPVDDLPGYRVDRERAAELLAEAEQSRLRISVLVGALYPEMEAIAVALRDQYARIGVTLEPEPVDWDTYRARLDAHRFHAFIGLYGSGNDPDRALTPAYGTDGAANAFRFSDAEIDRLLTSARMAPAREDRRSVYATLQLLIAELAPALVLCTRANVFAVGTDVTGFRPDGSQTWDTLSEVTIVEEAAEPAG